MSTHKFCSLCGRELPLESFPTNRGMKDGHLGKCFECWAMFTSDKVRVLAMAERKQVEPKVVELVPIEVEPIPKVVDNKPLDKKERARLRARERYRRMKADPVRYEAFKAKHREQALRAYHNRTEEQIKRDNERCKKWQTENHEKRRQAVKKWRENNREKYNEGMRRWRDEHPDRVIEYQIRYMERKLEKLKGKKSANTLQI